MPSPSTKKAKEKKVRVKIEPTEVKPLSDYVDDRLELIKQAFACLKPKTIKGITPKFLQKDSLEDIQEKCLDEVLGISKKRLLSIINDTKCPTDTESSDDDDEVEVISLEEISSEDESRVKGKTSTAKKNGAGAKKDKKKPESPKKIKEEKPPEEKKEFSVLELLELQARARAIRSQLALEPVTKIELDEDDEEPEKVAEEPKKKSSSDVSHEKDSSKKKSDKGSSSSSKASNGKSPSSKSKDEKKDRSKDSEKPEEPESSPKKLKRNFRKQSPVRDLRAKLEKKKEQKLEKAKRRQDDLDKSRESSPEVQPIVEVPVTLCISSSDEEGEGKQAQSAEPEKETPSLDKPLDEEKPVEAPEEGELDPEPSQDEIPSKTTVQDEDTATSNQKVTEEPVQKDDSDILSVQLDDDCIDLECDEPLEGEQEEEEVLNKVDGDAVEILDSSEDEAPVERDSASNDSKSWGERWLESSKVTKILATSKLGNQVRRKIQLSKKKEKQTSESTDAPEATEAPQETPDDLIAEMGSIDHYKKIVEKSAGGAKTDQ